jgi:PiT family inorganic phosphate transporter
LVVARSASINFPNKFLNVFELRGVSIYARLSIYAIRSRLLASVFIGNAMMTLLFFATCFLAYSNGANDNFKGVASLFGSRTCSYRTAISWATVTTFAGSLAAIFLAEALLKKFSGKGLVPDALVASPSFVMAVAIGAGATVILATLNGFPISTTHGLTGALVGAGFVAVGTGVNISALGKNFVLPLLLSPLLALGTGAAIYLVFRFVRLRSGITKELCVCIGMDEQVVPLPQPNGVLAAQVMPNLTLSVGTQAVCRQRYAGKVMGFSASRAVDIFHFLSAGAVSFARGLNDTPKIAALLLVAAAFDIRAALVAVAVAIGAGGLINAKRVAETMSHKITDMNPGQGFAANLSTAILVTTASLHGLPVSTTHVSVGSLLGMGVVTGHAKWKPVFGILASWIVTLPCAALIAAITYWFISRIG